VQDEDELAWTHLLLLLFLKRRGQGGCCNYIRNNLHLAIMVKKLYILTFISVFLLSVTGLPLTLHLCSMQDSAAITSCDICSSEPEKPSSCCSDNIEESTVYFAKVINTCCQEQLIDKKVEDVFYSKSELTNFSLNSLICLTIMDDQEYTETSLVIHKDKPPIDPGSGKTFLDISVLLI
jgi:hypothetical protein